ncbi:hypothetical protein BCR41DRAFT_367693 [Lobosporangium transversale]|uniref:Uncharacterized protein n=1 Tax=Lobosporangium transversale TaxID=64571 RepID=A0A1Y2GYH1_9FUNG|nr:hypothetical protein BCR41DRAFT_367693 [Lobosporangium transversale]ORZ27339.1 hypothetical protein BCR41DRAFT_367693 [Lobosporangium transversale]|eukprot:XP_021885066.1 hypothetical protein BCR41DRAFT_367693 [Lobosporangium transversale]
MTLPSFMLEGARDWSFLSEAQAPGGPTSSSPGVTCSASCIERRREADYWLEGRVRGVAPFHFRTFLGIYHNWDNHKKNYHKPPNNLQELGIGRWWEGKNTKNRESENNGEHKKKHGVIASKIRPKARTMNYSPTTEDSIYKEECSTTKLGTPT